MSAPTRELTALEQRIVAVKAALDGARAAYAHSPNGDTARIVCRVERDLDAYLDRLPRETP